MTPCSPHLDARGRHACLVLLVLLQSFFFGVVDASAKPSEPVMLSPRIGLEIDRNERDAYGLFPDIEGFEYATIGRVSEKTYRIDFRYMRDSTRKTGSRNVSAEAFNATREHVRLTEMYWAARDSTDAETNARVLYQMALRCIPENRYDLSVELLDELQRLYPAEYQSMNAEQIRSQVSGLNHEVSGLYQPQSLINRHGYINLMIFSGYYGLWLGIATPLAVGGDEASGEAVALGMIVGPALSMVIANGATSGRNITKTDAQMISMGGWMGTWQGLGWASYADLEGEAVLGIGIAGGLAGILLSASLNKAMNPSEGHAALMNASVWWGAWLGAMAGAAAGVDDVLPISLLGSDVLLLGTAVAARNTNMTRRRVRLMNLGGVLGGVGGLGVLVLGNIDDDAAAAGVVGACSLVGAAIAIAASKGETGLDSPTEMRSQATPSRGWQFQPVVTLQRLNTNSGSKRVPCLGLNVTF